jgi:hypothetical protein
MAVTPQFDAHMSAKKRVLFERTQIWVFIASPRRAALFWYQYISTKHRDGAALEAPALHARNLSSPEKLWNLARRVCHVDGLQF